jgi:ABC-type polysaccharide/polyol phosphate transport system ATPase subunit
VTPGRILVDRVSQRFRVSERPYRTIKDTVVARRRTTTAEVWALRDVSLEVEPGEALGLVGRNGSGKTTLLKLVSGIFRPTAGRVAVGGRIGSLLELGAGFHQDFTGRENVYLNGSIHGLSRSRVRELMDEIVSFAELERAIDLPVRTYSSGMYMRLGFSVAAHIQSDVLLLDEVFAVGDEEFQRKCFGKIHEFKGRGGTIVFVSHDAQAVERLCDRAVLLRQGSVVFNGETREAIAAYRRLLADDRSPDELAAGLRNWGSGEARIVSVRLLDSAGDPRLQFASGEPLTVELVVACEAGLSPPNVSIELREKGGLALGGVVHPTVDLGWGAGPGERLLRFEIERLPLAEGQFYMRCALIEAESGRLLDLDDEAARFFVFASGSERGALLLEGRLTVQEIGASAPIGKS